MEIGTLIKCSVYSIIKLVFVAFMGFIASKFVGFDERMRSGWSKLIFTFFLPAVIFYQTATAIDEISELKELWILPLGCLVHQILQFFVPLITGWIMRLPTSDNRVFTFTLGFANVMYVPMAISEALTDETDELGTDAKKVAFSYICTYQLTFMVCFFVFGYNYINLNTRDEKKEQERLSENEKPIEDIEIEMSDVKLGPKIEEDLQKGHTIEVSLNSHEHDEKIDCGEPHPSMSPGFDEIPNKPNSKELVITQEPKKSKFEPFCTGIKVMFSGLYQKIRKTFKVVSKPFVFLWFKLPEIVRFSIKNLFSIPTMAALLGVVFMLSKWIRDPLLVEGNWSIIGRCISYLGSCTVMCALFLLGGGLSNGPRGGTIPTWKVLIGVFIRMIVIPVLCWVATYLMYKYEVLPKNKVMYFVLQIEAFAPPALNSLVVVNVCYPKGTNSTATILFWTYMVAIFSLAVDIIMTMTTID